MSTTLTVAMELPRDLLSALEVPQMHLEERLRELIALELFREGRISTGKGAELLGISKLAFVQLLARHQVVYFTESPEELQIVLPAETPFSGGEQGQPFSGTLWHDTGSLGSGRSAG